MERVWRKKFFKKTIDYSTKRLYYNNCQEGESKTEESSQATTQELAVCEETVKPKQFLTPFKQGARIVNVRRGKQKANPTNRRKAEREGVLWQRR